MLERKEFSRLIEARSLAAAEVVETADLLEALSQIVGLLEEEALLAGKLGSVDGEPVAILVLPDEEDAGRDGAETYLVVTATREGELVWGSLRSGGEAPLGFRYEERERQSIDGFYPDRDQILGLYWTRSATIFRQRRDLILVTQQNGEIRVYEAPAQSEKKGLRFLGDQAPDWMKVCPVGGPIDHDLLASPPSEPPPAGATGAVLLNGRLHASVRVKLEGDAALEGESLHCLGDLLILSQRDQFLECFRPLGTPAAFELVWRRWLENQPAYTCPLPETRNGLRCLFVGHETGELSVLAVVGGDAIRDVWKQLADKLAANEGLHSFLDWVAWARSRIGSPGAAVSHAQIAAILRLLLESIPEDPKEREKDFTEEVARIFRQPLSFDEFLPVMSYVREIMRRWASGESCFAADAIKRVYGHLPYELQDLFDLELQRHPRGDGAAGQGAVAEAEFDARQYQELLTLRDVNREKLFANPSTKALPRVALLTEEWLEPYVLDRALPSLQPSSARLRALPEPRTALIVHPEALLSRRGGADTPMIDITPDGWCPASQAAFVVARPDERGPLLVVANERKLALVAVPDPDRKAVIEHEYLLPSDRSLALAGSGDGGLVVLVVTGSPAWASRPEVWLFSLSRREVVARAELPARVPRELAILPAGGGKSWWLVSDVADDEVGLLKMTLAGERLELEESARRRVYGRIRSAGGFPGDRHQPPRILIGTTEGYVASFLIGRNSPSFDLQWIYRARGAIRHLDLLPANGQVYSLALTAAGSALLFDSVGRCLWHRRLQSALRSGALLHDGDQVMPGLIDAESNVWIYRQTTPAQAWRKAQEELPKVPREQWEEEGTSRWEMAHAVCLLSGGQPAWGELGNLQTETARACFLRFFGEWLEKSPSIDELRPALADLVAASRLRELAILARLSGATITRRLREAVVLALLQEVAERTAGSDQGVPGLEQEARELLAELVRGLGAGILVPSQLGSADFEAWRQIPRSIREDSWVLWSLLLASTVEEAPNRKLPALLEQATFLGPAALKDLPMFVPLADHGFAEALQLAVKQVEKGSWGLHEKELQVLRSTPLQGQAAVLAHLLALLHDDQPEWQEFLALVDETERKPNAAFHPALAPFLGWRESYREIKAEDFDHRPVAEQIQVLDRLASEEPLSLPDPSGVWTSWLNAAGQRLHMAVNRSLDERRKELKRWQWVRVHDMQVERFSGRLAALRMRLQKDGRDRVAAKVSLSIAHPGGGLAPLEGENAASWSWDEVKEDLTWFGFLEDAAAQIKVRSVTEVEQEVPHESWWTAEIPIRARSQGTAALESLPALRRELLKPVLGLKRGLRLISLDDDLGAQQIVSDLIQARGTEVVELDEALKTLGPGREDPAGFTADRILEALGARRYGANRWRIRAADRRRILARPAEETLTRLLRPALGAVLERFRQGLAHLEGPPVLLVLPTEVAARIQTALVPHAQYHALYHLGHLDPASEAAKELESWMTVAGGLSKAEARAALACFGGNLRLIAAWIGLPKGARPEPLEYLVSPQGAERLQPEWAGVGPRELGDLVIAARSRVRLAVRELVTGMQAAQKVLSTPKSGAPTAIVSDGQELTDKILSDIRSDPGRHQELWVHGYPPDGKNVTVSPDVKALHRALQRDSASIWQSHRLWEQRRVLRINGPLAHLVSPYRAWIEDQLANDSTGRGLIEGLHGKNLLDSLTFRELAAAGDALPDLCPDLPVHSPALIRGLGALDASGGESRRVEALCHSLTGCPLRPLPVPDLHPALSAMLSELLGNAPLFKVERRDPGITHLLGYLASAPSQELGQVASLLTHHPGVVLTLFGPGLPKSGFRERGDLCLLRDENLKEVLVADDLPRAFWKAVRNRVGLIPFSPFQVGNHLDENSPVFVGREREMQRILEGIATTSFLILGGRQIGKTSLLRHCYGEIGEKGKSRVTRIWLDCAGLGNAGQFREALRAAGEKDGFSVPLDGDPISVIERTLRGLSSPVLFLNEVDGLMLQAPDLMQRLRSLSEGRACQFVMVGYLSTFESLRQSGHPLYHWVQGETGDKAFFLGALSERAARLLVDKLFDPPLELQCQDDQTRSQIYTILLEVSHRIPFFLQGACQRLVQRLDREGRSLIRKGDVETVLRSGQDLVWEYLKNTKLVPPVDGHLGKATVSSPDQEIWGDLVLTSIVRELFYRPEPRPIDDPRLRQVPPGRFKFTLADIKRYVSRALKDQGLFPAELAAIEHRFTNEAYSAFLDGATLTVLVAPLFGGERAFHFPDYIYPIELERYLQRQKKSIDSHIFQLTADLLDVLEKPREPGPQEAAQR